MKPLNLKIQNYYIQTGVGNDFIVMWKYGEGRHVQTADILAITLTAAAAGPPSPAQISGTDYFKINATPSNSNLYHLE